MGFTWTVTLTPNVFLSPQSTYFAFFPLPVYSLRHSPPFHRVRIRDFYESISLNFWYSFSFHFSERRAEILGLETICPPPISRPSLKLGLRDEPKFYAQTRILGGLPSFRKAVFVGW